MISIIPRGIGALGFTQQLPDEERYLMSEAELRDRIAVLLGGRSAEEEVFGTRTTGAQDDLRKATEIARRMVMEFGMSEAVGPINISPDGGRFLNPLFRRGEDVSEETEVAIDREVKQILLKGQERAREIVKQHRKDLDALKDVLLQKETIGGKEFEQYFGRRVEPAAVSAAEQGLLRR
jgi:cell division protease FtsH